MVLLIRDETQNVIMASTVGLLLIIYILMIMPLWILNIITRSY